MTDPQPILVYRCARGDCGNLMAGVFLAEDLRPVLAHNEANSLYRHYDELEEHVGRWVDPEELTPGPPQRIWNGITTGIRMSPRPIELSCRRHGIFQLTRSAVVEHFTEARAGGDSNRRLA